MANLCFVVALACGMAMAADYRIAPEPGSQFKLEVHKTGLMSGKVHVFTYRQYQGSLSYDAARPELSRVEFTVDAKSVVCEDTWIDEKDKKKVTEMAHKTMEDDRHPQLRFVSESVAKRSDGSFDVRGSLSIKGISKLAVITVTLQPEAGGLRFKGNAIVMRKDYKIDPASAIPFGIIGNKPEMPVAFSLLALPAR